MFKFTARARILTVVMLMVYLFGTLAAPTWYTSTFHPFDWIPGVYAQSNVRTFPIEPTAAAFLIANGSTTQDFYVIHYGLTVSTGITSGSGFQFVHATNTGANDCALNQTDLSGEFTAVSGTTQFNKESTPQGDPIMKVPRGQDFCLLTTFPAMNVDGFLSGFYQSE